MAHFEPQAAARFIVGFDKVLNLLERTATEVSAASRGYPPHNIERIGDDRYRITIAVAGFSKDEIEVNTTDGILTIKGRKGTETSTEKRQYLHQGIATRSFDLPFRLFEYVEVKSASLENGILSIDMVRELPEAKRPRKIDIETVA